MNKKIDHILPTVASAEVNDLKELLEEILAKLTDGNIPDMESLDYLKASVHRYLHTVENAPSKQPQTSVYVHFEEGKITDTVLDKTILECFTIPEIVRLIHRLTLEKIVRTSETEVSDEYIAMLLKHGLATEVTVHEDDISDIHYYMLTNNGWQILADDSVEKSIQSIDHSFLLPKASMMSSDMVSEQTIYGLHQIKKFYSGRSDVGYMVFSDKEISCLLLGCDISSRHSTDYCIAGACVAHWKNEIGPRIHYLCKTGKIGSLTIVVDTKEDENHLKLQTGLDEKVMDHLKYFNLLEDRNEC